mgnify:CR=1 FL=1
MKEKNSWALDLFFLPLLLTNKNRKNIEIVAVGSVLPSFREFGKMALTFILVTVTWVVFRADSITIGVDYIINMFSFNELDAITFYFLHPGRLLFPLFIWFVLFGKISPWRSCPESFFKHFSQCIYIYL